MTLSNSPLAYEDAYAALEAATADPAGVRIRMNNLDAAIYFRMRCHQARKIDRNRNLETYEKTDPLYGVSAYDRLALRIEQDADGVWLRIEKHTIIPGEIESLSGGHVVTELPARMPEPRKKATVPLPPTDELLGKAFDEMPTAPEPEKKVRRI